MYIFKVLCWGLGAKYNQESIDRINTYKYDYFFGLEKLLNYILSCVTPYLCVRLVRLCLFKESGKKSNKRDCNIIIYHYSQHL